MVAFGRCTGQGPFGPVFRVRCRFGVRWSGPHHRGMIPRTARAPHGSNEAPCRVLLVSDHRGASDALGAHLAHHGLTIVAHEGGAQSARAAAAREQPDVVLIDAAVRGGWQQVVRAIDAVPPGRIAVLAAYWSTESRRAATTSGIGATLLKHVEGGELVTRLRELAEPTH